MAVLSAVINLSRRAKWIHFRLAGPEMAVVKPKEIRTESLLTNLNWEERENRLQLAIVAPIRTIR